MRSLRALLSVLVILCCNVAGHAQSFNVLVDTIHVTEGPFDRLYTDSVATGQGPVVFSWEVRDCNFPADWIDGAPVSALCDNSYCRNLSGLWPSGSRDSTFQYPAYDTGILTLALGLTTNSTPGCYYITVRLRDVMSYSSNVTETWMVCFNATEGITKNEQANISLYPNPVTDELNIRSANASDVTIYNLTGERLKTAGCINGTATIMLNDLPPGMYVARITDTDGTTTAIRKFVKE